MNAGGAPRDNADPLHVRWGRRAVTIPAYSLAALLLLSVTPILLPGVVVADVVRRRNFALVRSLLMVDVYLLAEALGILASLVIWATFGGWQREASPAYLKRNFSLQCRWAAVLFWSARRIFRLRLEVDGEECVRTDRCSSSTDTCPQSTIWCPRLSFPPATGCGCGPGGVALAHLGRGRSLDRRGRLASNSDG